MRARELLTDDGAISPVVSAVLMVAVVILLGIVVSTMVFDVSGETQEGAPRASFSFEVEDGRVTVTHQSGDRFDGDRLKFAGAAVQKTEPGRIIEWRGENVSAGDSATVLTRDGELELVWVKPGSESSQTVASQSVPRTVTDGPVCTLRLAEAWGGGTASGGDVVIQTGEFDGRTRAYLTVHVNGILKFGTYVDEHQRLPFYEDLGQDRVDVRVWKSSRKNTLIDRNQERVRDSSYAPANNYQYCG